jgi:uncharacterized protein (DUF3820 family)
MGKKVKVTVEKTLSDKRYFPCGQIGSLLVLMTLVSIVPDDQCR